MQCFRLAMAMRSAKRKGHSCVLAPHLLLGNALSSGSVQVDAVLSIGCQPLPNARVQHRHQLSMPDSTDSDLTPHLDAATAFIQRHLAAQRAVLVHCKGGINRSPAVVVAYLVRYASPPLTLDEAVAWVKRHHPSARMQPHYLQQINQWSRQRRSETTSSASAGDTGAHGRSAPASVDTRNACT